MPLLRPVLACALILIMTSASIARSDETVEGVWIPETAELGGKPFPEEIRKAIRLEIKGDQYTVTVANQPDRGTCKLNPSAQPKELDITGTEGPNKGKTILAIYDRNGDKLRVCYDLTGKARPKEFKTTAGSQLFLVEYKLKKD